MDKRRIPVGYLTKTAADICKGDVVKDIGKILSIKHVGEHTFFDPNFQIEYTNTAIELKTKSALTGRMLYEVLPLDAKVEILMYETI